MARPYSADLRERVLLAGEAGLLPAVIAERFGVGLSTVYLWRQQLRAEGRRCAKPHGGGRARGIDAAGEAIPGLRWGRLCGHWSPSTRTAHWTSTESNWRNVPAGLGSAGQPCTARYGGSGWGAKKTLRASEQSLPRRRPGTAPTSKRSGPSSARRSGSLTPKSWSLSTRPASPRQ